MISLPVALLVAATIVVFSMFMRWAFRITDPRRRS